MDWHPSDQDPDLIKAVTENKKVKKAALGGTSEEKILLTIVWQSCIPVIPQFRSQSFSYSYNQNN